jgi:glycosyltransferase involved in cell wall biosynthesis
MKSLRILGIRGVPAAHGGFETFAEHLSLYLVQRGWRVIVYCQEDEGSEVWRDEWCGVDRVHIPVRQSGPLGTIIFDWRSTRDAAKHGDACLTLGYNTAFFTLLLRLKGIPNIINMDGIEWSRAKWGLLAKLWFWMNERAGCWLGDHLVADHPEIRRHLSTRTSDSKITTIAYGAQRLADVPSAILDNWGLQPGRFLTLIARAEPENSILEIVQGFSQKRRGMKLVVMGNYDKSHPYQTAVLAAASDEVIFTGAIYDKSVVHALRFYSAAYVHGHQVGGTNPSLVEALGAGNPVIAHDNRFNRWVAGPLAGYFEDAESFSDVLEDVLNDAARLQVMRAGSSERFEAEFTWDNILRQYETLLARHC